MITRWYECAHWERYVCINPLPFHLSTLSTSDKNWNGHTLRVTLSEFPLSLLITCFTFSSEKNDVSRPVNRYVDIILRGLHNSNRLMKFWRLFGEMNHYFTAFHKWFQLVPFILHNISVIKLLLKENSPSIKVGAMAAVIKMWFNDIFLRRIKKTPFP